ncbi:MAG: hypothetical protein K7J46_14900, partial [Bryobacter sp.]|nr:hypothetical protein [Bryobacter sp. CoA8 C33]
LPVKRCALKIFLPHPQAHAKALGQPLQAHFAFLLGAKNLARKSLESVGASLFFEPSPEQ